MNGRQPEEMENEMGQNIFVGILCVLALGACVWHGGSVVETLPKITIIPTKVRTEKMRKTESSYSDYVGYQRT